MCGRFLTPDESAFERFFALKPPEGYRRSFNVAPSQLAAVIRTRRDGSRAAELFVWGYKPRWAERAWINARAETVFTSRAFADSARSRRCLVPAAGWYEWQGERAPKQPYVHFRGEFAPIAFAGIWTTSSPPRSSERARRGQRDAVPNEPGEPLRTFAILTRDATSDVAHVHDRMPAVLAPEHYATWLDPNAARDALERILLAPGPEVLTRRISMRVNKPEHDDADCIAPLDETGTG